MTGDTNRETKTSLPLTERAQDALADGEYGVVLRYRGELYLVQHLGCEPGQVIGGNETTPATSLQEGNDEPTD